MCNFQVDNHIPLSQRTRFRQCEACHLICATRCSVCDKFYHGSCMTDDSNIRIQIDADDFTCDDCLKGEVTVSEKFLLCFIAWIVAITYYFFYICLILN